MTAEQWAEKIVPHYTFGVPSDATPQPIRDAIEAANSGRAAELVDVASVVREAMLAEREAIVALIQARPTP